MGNRNHRLQDTQQDSNNSEGLPTLNKTNTEGYNAPADCQKAQPGPRPEFLESNVARQFKKNITNIEDTNYRG